MPNDPWGVASVKDAPAADPWGVSSVSDAKPEPGRPANYGLGSAWDTISNVGSHLANAVSGPVHAFTDPATPEEQKEFNGQDLSGVGAHLSLGAKRLLVDPSLRSIQAGNAARQAGDINGAITNYAQAVPVVGPMEKQAVQTAQTQGALPAMAGILTDLGVAKATGKVADTLAAPARAGEAMQASGLDRINKYLGSKPGDMRNGANPARAVVNQVQGIPLTRGGLSGQLDAASPRVGQQLGNVIRAADSNPAAAIPTKALRPAVEDPIFGRAGQVVGPAGSMNTGPLNTLLGSMEQPAPGVGVPIYGPNAPATVAPTQLWNTIQNMDSNLKYSTDPEVEGVNEVGRDVRGGLRQQLETADPNIKPLSRQYGDIRAAQDVLERKPSANAGVPISIPHIVGRTLNAAPVQVGLGKMANAAGGGISAVGRVLNPANTPGNIGDAAVVGSLGSSDRVVDQNAAPDQGEVAQPEGNENQDSTGNEVQDQHGVSSIDPGYHPDTHSFSTKEWIKGNPSGDPDEAREQAQTLGFDVTD